MSLWFLTKWYDLYWPPCWRVYSCLPTWRPKLLFVYISAKVCCKRYHITFSTFCAKKEVIHNFKNYILVTWLATNLLILRKWCGFEKPNHYILFKIWPTNRFSNAESYNFHFHKNDVTWPLSANDLLLWLYQILLANISGHWCPLYIGLVTFFTYLEATHLSVFHRCSTRFPCNIQ